MHDCRVRLPGLVPLLVGAVLAAGSVLRSAPPDRQQTAPEAVLLQQGNLRYAGAFLPPAEANLRYDHSGHGLTFDAERGTLFVSNFASRVSEISIPDPGQGPLADLPVAELRQGPADVLDGKLRQAGDMIGGLLVDGDDLLVSVYRLYDAAGRAARSHFRTSRTFPPDEVHGPAEVGRRRAGFVGGPMARVPLPWQARMGGPVLTGLCCTSIISRTSSGPTATVFDPADLDGRATRVDGEMLLGYPQGRATLGEWNSSGTLFNNGTEMAGMVWPEGTDSILFFGRKGEKYCYGSGEHCGDPSSPHKGDHAYPYEYFVWAYDARDLEMVKRGRRDPWDVRPYATWAIDLPFPTPARIVRGLAYDPQQQRLFLAEQRAVRGSVVIRVLDIVRP